MLREYNVLLPTSGLALLRPDGTVFAAANSDDGDAAASEAAADIAADLEAAGMVALPVYAGGELVAQIASRSTAAAILPALQRTFSLIMQGNLEKREVARETLDRYREINLLYSTTETIGACLNPDEIPSLVLKESARVIPADAGLVLLRSNQGEGELEQHAAYPFAGENLAADSATTAGPLLQYASELVERVMQTGRPDIRSSDGAYVTLLCAPLKARSRALGAVLLARANPPAISGTEKPRQGEDQIQFTAGEEKLLMVLASQAGVAIEKAWMHRQELQRQRMEQELSISRRIQRSLLPETLPRLSGWQFAAYYQAAREVGGDFYDFFETTLAAAETPTSTFKTTLGLFIADVTGKGVPAALMMAFSRAMLHSLLQSDLHFIDKPAEVLKRLNTLLLKDNRTGMLLTALYASLEPGSGRLLLANAGHERPVWLRAIRGEYVELSSNGTLLGAFSNLSLEEREIILEPGDLFVLYTDGVTEARSPDGELFGEERLKDTLRTCLDASAEEAAQAIHQAVQSFSASAPQSDDFTVMVIKRSGDR